MADNTEEEHLENPANNQSENPSDEITPAKDSDTITPNQEIENMEVHKHPHHVTHKKKWGEYFIEFLMLFLAVYLGFLAENYREHQVEKERGKQYIESFYQDLKTDTAKISFIINFDSAKLISIPNLSSCYNTTIQDGKETTYSRDIIKNSFVISGFYKTERTNNQLFNAGGFRLLSKEDADSIIMYQKEYDVIKGFQATALQDAQDRIRNTFSKVVNFKAYNQMFNMSKGSLTKLSFNDSVETFPLFFTSDKSLLNQYFNELQAYFINIFYHRELLLNLRVVQNRLLKYLEDKYNFREEHD